LAAKDTWFVQFERPQSRIFYGWVIVATAAVGLLFGAFPISVASFGIFFPAYVTDFHARRSAISLAFTTHNLVAALSTFAIGQQPAHLGGTEGWQ
jgi:hypothetical protein